MNLSIKLSKNFTEQYNKLQDKYGEDMARLNGFSQGQLSYTDFISNFQDQAVIADASVDASSNVANKDVVALLNEMSKPHMKLLSFHKIFYDMQKLYGYKDACNWLEQEWIGKLYMHDAPTASYKSYCFAYDLKDLAERGLYFIGNFNAEPPKHLTTFVDFVKEFVSYFCVRTSGAVGLPNLIPYMYYFWREDVKNKYYTKDPDTYARQNIQRLIYSLNQPFLREQIQSAFTNTSVYDTDYLMALFGGAEFPDGSDMVDDIDEIMRFQKVYMEVMSEIRSHNMMTFPVSTICLLRKDGKFADPEFAEWAIKHNMKWCDSNFFIDDSVTSLSNCCRLKSDIKELYFNSIGGTALKVGSVKVSTVNLARIALESDTEKEYLVNLKNTVELNLKVLDTQRHIIRRNVEKGLMPHFDCGAIDFEHLYSTVGFIGIYETMKSFGYTRTDEFGNTFYTADADAFGKKIFDVIHETINLFALDKDYKINLEQIPGESAADKLMQKDKIFYPDKVIDDLPLYGNQFIPLGIKTTVPERIRIAALFDEYCGGGSILHANVESPFTSYEQAKELTEYIADAGVTYFAFNTKIQACANNHGFIGTKCPLCGGSVATEYTRIVGFYTPIKTWSKPRKMEYTLREWENVHK